MTDFKNHLEISRNFWTSKVTYPAYDNIKKRRLYELNYLVPKLQGNSILDLGCGDGALINCLYHLTDFTEYYAYDLSENLLKNVNKQIKTAVYDCNFPSVLPKVDIVILAGVLPFIFEDEKVLDLFNFFNCKEMFVRAPCSELNITQIINTYSKQLNENYSSIYRTPDEISKLINHKFNLIEILRIYPDEIESKFGTKQYYFHAVKKAT